MFSIPYSRYLFYPVTWYSVLIVTGAALALFLACKEEKRSGHPKDTVLDLALWLIPGGIIGARLYYVVFSFDQFRNDLLSVFRIWEGGLAIYGGIIAGLLVLFIFCRYRKLSFLLLCDMIAPGLALAQCIGRWGNWFNTEAFGLPVTGSFPRFFPLAVQIPSDGYSWHFATFFYESMWDLAVFVFLVISRRTFLKRKNGDVFFFYLFLYAAGRLVIEELRTDSLFTSFRETSSYGICTFPSCSRWCTDYSFVHILLPSPFYVFLYSRPFGAVPVFFCDDNRSVFCLFFSDREGNINAYNTFPKYSLPCGPSVFCSALR